jgi:glutamate racemase
MSKSQLTRERIGVMDWGIGGLGVYQHLKKQYPNVDITYLSDTGFTPYGKLSAKALKLRVMECLNFFRGNGVSKVIVGCNAASTVLDHILDTEALSQMRVIGVINPCLSAILAHKKQKCIGIIGGKRTIFSQSYSRPLRDNGFLVYQRVAQPLSSLIEKGELNSERTREEVKRIILPLKRNCIEILVLACTHYPAIMPLFAEILPDVIIVDPTTETVKTAGNKLALSYNKNHQIANGHPRDKFFTTGDSGQMKQAAYAAFKVRLGDVTKISRSLR